MSEEVQTINVEFDPDEIKIPDGYTVEDHWDKLIKKWMRKQGFTVYHDCGIMHKGEVENCICEDKSKWGTKKLHICRVGHYWLESENVVDLRGTCKECDRIRSMMESAARIAGDLKRNPPDPNAKKDLEISNKLRNAKNNTAGELERKKAELQSLMIAENLKPFFEKMISLLEEIKNAKTD